MRYGIDVAMAVDQVASVWIVACERTKSVAHAILETLSHFLEPVFAGIAVQAALESFGWIHVNYECQVRIFADHRVVKLVHERAQFRPRRTLIHAR